MSAATDAVWTPERAQAWMGDRGWRVGCNFIPSTASNALEMWQEASFDPKTIERELGFAAHLGFTSVRVFLHDLVWKREEIGLVTRIEHFLELAARHGIGVLWVFFDGVWNPHPRPGPQPEPRPGVHNAGWVQSPGAEILADPARHADLREYVQAVIDRFRDDPRIDGWDLFNEPDNPNFAYARREVPGKPERALELLRAAFEWAREVDPSQPLTAGVWQGRWSDRDEWSPINRLSLESSDVVSFHHYGELDELEHHIASLQRLGRPLLCTEFMARGVGSRFEPHLAALRKHEVGAYCWGLVAGRTQTHYPWDSWRKAYTEEPVPWHHDILRPDGTAYDLGEVAFIRSLCVPRADAPAQRLGSTGNRPSKAGLETVASTLTSKPGLGSQQT